MRNVEGGKNKDLLVMTVPSDNLRPVRPKLGDGAGESQAADPADPAFE